MATLNGLPGDPEVWLYSPTGWYFLVYFVPGTDIPITYTTSPAEMQAAFGPGQPIVVAGSLYLVGAVRGMLSR